MKQIYNFLLLLGRIIIALVFLLSGIGKIFKFGWFENFVQSSGLIHLYPGILWVCIAMLIEILGSLAVITGLYTRWSALVVSVFMIIIIILYHLHFATQQQVSTIVYHSAVVGGLLLIIGAGPGDFSIDALIKKKK